MIDARRMEASSSLAVLAVSGCLFLGGAFGLPSSAGATAVAPGPPWTVQSRVDAVVTDQGNGSWTYQYTVNNTSVGSGYGGANGTPIIVDWEIPYFGDFNITPNSITSPSLGWNHTIEQIGVPNLATGWEGVASWQTPGDPFYVPGSPFNDVTHVLHWFVGSTPIENLGIYPIGAANIPSTAHEGSLGGFGFTAAFGPTAGPYQASWIQLPVRSGDPPLPSGLLPLSPCAQGQCAEAGVPLPGTIPLAVLGLALVGLTRYRKRG